MSSFRKLKTRRLVLQIALGAVIFVAIAGVVLGLSIMFGLLKSPMSSGGTDDEAETTAGDSINAELFPYSTEEYRVEYSSGSIRVYMFPSLSSPGTIDSKQERIQREVIDWLESNGVDTEKTEIDWRTK